MHLRSLVVVFALLATSCGDEYVNVGGTTAPGASAPVGEADVSQLVGGRAAAAPADTPPMDIESATPAGPALQIEGTIDGASAVIGLPVVVPSQSLAAAYFDEADGAWHVAGGVVDAASGRVYVETSHLSVWQAISIPGWEAVAALRDILADFSGLGDRGDPPACIGEPVTTTVSAMTSATGGLPSDSVFRLDACATLEPDGRYRVKLVNRRPVAVRISTDTADATVVSVQLPNSGDMIALGLDKLGRLLGQPTRGGMLLSAGGSMELLVSGPAVFFGEVDNAGTAWTVILQAITMNGSAGWDAFAELSERWNFTTDAPGDWKELTTQALEQLWHTVFENAGDSVLVKLARVMSSSLVVAVRGAFEGGLAPWFGNQGVRIDVYGDPVEEAPPAGLTSCEGTDMSLFDPEVVNVVCSYPWALAESTTMIGSGPTVIVGLITTDPRAFVTSWWEVEEGPELSGYTVQALIDAGVEPAAAQAMFDALDACNGCAYRS